MTTREDPEEQSAVKRKNDEVEEEPGHIEYEALVDPLLSIIQFNSSQLVFEIVLNTLQHDSNKLSKIKS